MFTIEVDALKCTICGRSVSEGGPMIGSLISEMIHPDCLLADPFLEYIFGEEKVDVAKEVYEDNERFILSLYLEDLEM